MPVHTHSHTYTPSIHTHLARAALTLTAFRREKPSSVLIRPENLPPLFPTKKLSAECIAGLVAVQRTRNTSRSVRLPRLCGISTPQSSAERERERYKHTRPSARECVLRGGSESEPRSVSVWCFGEGQLLSARPVVRVLESTLLLRALQLFYFLRRRSVFGL